MSYPASLLSRHVCRHLLVGAATLAIAGSILPRPATAQSFQGTPTVTVGGATVVPSPNTTTININAPITSIDWRPNDTNGTGNILFQPAGTTALFRSINFQEFTVLNRILPVDINGAPVVNRPIRFNGTVNSQFGAVSPITSGSVWFYTPGGIILGAGSAFNVGSLVLSTSDINPANIFVGNNGTISFTGTPNPSSAITLESGAQVNALINGSSYVAMVAPRVVQNGTISVDGSAALVGAEAVDITMNGPGGLFDISVTTGTGDANGVVHGDTGITTGPSKAGAGDEQRIYMMAIPKNTAISMLLNGSIGYAPAVDVELGNGEVILSAGYNIANGNVSLGEHATPVSSAAANMTIGATSNQSTSFTSNVLARASGNLLASPGAAVNGLSLLSFSESAFLFGDISSVVEASNNSEIVAVGRDLFVSSRRGGQGGNAAVRALGGLIGVGGNLTVDASAIGFSGQASGILNSNPNGGNGRGGNASINLIDGDLRITGTTQVLARGIGGYGNQSMGTGFGGNASVSLSGTAANALFTGGLDVQGSGYGILSYLALFGASLELFDPVDGGSGVGGSASVSIDDIDQLILPTLTINASGYGDYGGTQTGGRGGRGGNGTGGTASLTLNNEALDLSEIAVEARGFGGDGARSDDPGEAAGNGGAGAGGTATIALTGTASFGASGFSSAMVALANGRGGRGGDAAADSALDSGSGGAASGGTARISIGGSAQVNVATLGAFANAESGYVGTGSNFGGTGITTGGNASIAINTSGTVDADLLIATANALTVETSRTGNASAGTANVTIANGTVNINEINVFANADIDTEAGENVGSLNGMLAGTNTGGTALLSVTGGSLNANRAFVTATAVGVGQQRFDVGDVTEDSPVEQVLAGGAGVGGQATFSISGGSASLAETLSVDASGRGGNGYINADSFATQPAVAGAGGAGTGGIASFNIAGGLLTVPTVDLRAEGTGGNGGDFWGLNAGDAGAGGSGTGGTTNFTAARDVFAIDTLTLSALGLGGIGGVSAEVLFDGFFTGYGDGAATGGEGGTGRGGSALMSLDFDPVLASLFIDTSGVGGTGSLGLVGGRGGDGFGGSGASGARLALNFGDLTVNALTISSNGAGGDGGEGTGGPGGIGGNGTGGDAELLVNGNGSNLVTTDLLIQANGTGGNGGFGGGASNGAAGGNALGGNARLTISNAATGNLGSVVIEANALGGDGSDASAGLTGGNGGNATGGSAALIVSAATAVSTNLLVQSNGTGGETSDSGFGGDGGTGTGGSASVAVSTGSFSTADATITANGIGGTPDAISTGGTAAISAIGGSIDFVSTFASANGETGAGAGGLVSILAGADAFGASGTMDLGDTTLASDSLDGVAGIVRINNNNNNAAGGVIRFGQLSASADGLAPSNPAGGVFIRSNQSDILVTGNANLFARDSIGIDGVGQGTFAAGNVFAAAGSDIVITHAGQPGLVDTVRGTIVSLFANRNFDAQVGSIIRGTNSVDIVADRGSANIDQLFAVNSGNIRAALDASLRNATVSNGSLNFRAGFRTGGSFAFYQLATANVIGAVTASNDVNIESGGDVVVSGGANIRAGNNVILSSGDDIIIRNAAISSAQNVTTTGNIRINVGSIAPINPIAGEVRSLVVANSILTSAGYDLILAADAIDATTGIFNANRLTALVNNAPASGVAGSNDGGLLAANCVQGNICLGAVSTPTQILVGPATGTIGLANRVTMAGSLASNNISIRARDGVAFTGPISVVAANSLLVSVSNGPIDLTGAVSLTGVNALNLYAGAGAITGPNAALVSNGNIGLFANGGIVLGSIDTGGVLNTIANDGTVTTAGILVTPGSVTVNGQLAVRGGTANVNSGGAITTGSILTTAGNDVLLTSVGAQSLGTVNTGRDLVVNAASLSTGAVTAQRNVVATAGGGITLGNTIAGNDILLNSGGAQTLGALNAGRDIIVNAASLNAASLTAQRNVGATVTGGIATGNISSGNDVLLTSGGAQTLGAVNAGRDVTIGAASLNATAITAQRNVSATTGGGITLGNSSAGNDILLSSGGAQSLGATSAGRDIVVNAASLNAASIAATRNVNATVTGSATLGNTSGALINMRAGQDLTFNGTAAATTAIDLGANGQAAFNGVASAPNITVRSGNIAIGGSGRLGTIGTTQNVVLTNSAGAQMTIGGSGVTAGYSLSDAEIARIFGNNIDIGWTANLANTGAPTMPPMGGYTQPSIIVGALTLSSRAGNAAGNLGANGTLSIRTPGTIQVNGAVALNGAGNGNIVQLSAGQSLQIIAGQGSIAIRDDANALAGTLNLNSDNIIAASTSAMADIAGQTDKRLIDTRLGQNDGFVSDTGILSANIVNLNAGSNVFVQNTGSSSLFRDRRGITANAINVSFINPNGVPNANGLIVINGQITAAPSFATGLSAIPLLSINGVPSQTATGFDTLSTMNGCQITAIAACRQRENPVSVTDDDINQPLDPGQAGDNQFPTALIEVKEFETFGYPPLIDEPVTGSGNDDLWPATCDPEKETCPVASPPAPQ